LLRFDSVVDGSTEQPVRWPVAVAAASADEIAVADAWNNRLLVFRRVGAGWPVDRAIALPAPPAAMTFSQGHYLVALRGTAKLWALASAGGSELAEGSALPSGVVPGALAVTADGALIVWDAAGGRIGKLRGGELTVTVSIEESVSALASDGGGGFWAAVGEAGEIRRFDASASPVARWKVPDAGPVPSWPAGVAVESGGRVFVLDRHGHRLVVFDATGRWVGVGGGQGSEPGQLLAPSALALLPTGELLVADLGNGRMQIFDPIAGAPP
jgi:DNA-binding beta-propeller fold protein YncE